MIAELLTVIAPVVICAAIGFLWSRRGEPFDVGQVTRISVTLGTPCLIVWTFEQTRPEPDVFLEIAAAITFEFASPTSSFTVTWGKPANQLRNYGANIFFQASTWGSIVQAIWSFMLALRARGLGSAWTTGHLFKEKEMAELLGIPFDRYTQTGLFPIAYTKGTDFRKAWRKGTDEVVSWNGFSG